MLQQVTHFFFLFFLLLEVVVEVVVWSQFLILFVNFTKILNSFSGMKERDKEIESAYKGRNNFFEQHVKHESCVR